MTEKEKLEIAASLEDYHKCFYLFFEMSTISFSDDTSTAAVSFHPQGKSELLLNEEFWRAKTYREQLFIICHECLHVLLDHGVRNARDLPGSTPKLVNVAQDITINEMIVDLFKFDREEIKDWKKFCWIDTCFKNPILIKRNETFYYYLEELIKNPPEGDPELIDEHGEPSESQSEIDAKQKIAKKIAQELDVDELNEIIKNLPEGHGEAGGPMSGIYDHLISKKVESLKINFKQLIRKLKRTSIKEVPVDIETFTHDDRRFSGVLRRSDIFMPGKAEISKPNKDKLLTVVFMDISGSCIRYLPTFSKVFSLFDAEREIFDSKMFTFDTKVLEVHVGSNIRAGGGTNFKIIEDKCRSLEAETGRYPDCVIVITDGEGTKVDPKAPSKWVWLLTKGGVKTFIHSKSRSFFISQVTF
jgi:predicted metal-dependent peptidase